MRLLFFCMRISEMLRRHTTDDGEQATARTSGGGAGEGEGVGSIVVVDSDREHSLTLYGCDVCSLCL